MAEFKPKPRDRRGPDDSSSAFGQFIHDELRRTFNAVDDDRVVLVTKRALKTHARCTGILRHLEHYHPGGELSRAQLEVLPLLAACFFYGVHYRVLQPGSGVYVVESAAPYEDGIVAQIIWTPDGGWDLGEPSHLAGREFAEFIGAHDGQKRDLRREAA